MEDHSRQLTELTEEQRVQAYERYRLLRPYFEEGVAQTVVARMHQMPLSTVQRWVRQYREGGLCGLARVPRSDRGKRRDLPLELQQVIEGLALCTPRRSIATIHRQVSEIAVREGWSTPSYGRVYQIIKNLSPALVTLAHEGGAAYRETFDLIYRREASHPNEIWQADHCKLHIWVRDEQGKVAKPWLTTILDDASRALAGYRLSWSAPSAVQTALTLRQAIWRKEEPTWHVCGIPQMLYTDHGSDFTSTHLEQVAADLKIQWVFSQVGRPRGRGKVERFFQTVEQLFLERQPGYAPKQDWSRDSTREVKDERDACLELEEFERRFRAWLLEDYHFRVQQEQDHAPQERWEEDGFLPVMPVSLEQLDLLLVTVRKKRRVQQDGIAFEGYHYIDPTLASYVGEDVLIRYDPADMAEIRIFFDDRFVCRAICLELSGQTVSLKEIVAARSGRCSQIRETLAQRKAVVQRFARPNAPGVNEELLVSSSHDEAGRETAEAEVTLAEEDQSPKRSTHVHLKRYRNE